MKTLHVSLQLVLLSAVVSSTPAIRSQGTNPPNAILDRHIGTLQLRNTRLSETLIDALKQQQVPGGIAVSYYCGGYQNHLLKPADDTLRSLLDAAVAAEPEYTWSVDNGAVNLVPRYREPLFLETAIPKLEISDAGTTNEALNELLAIPEVSKQASLELGIRTFGGGGPYGYGPEGAAKSKISLSLTNVTVRQALNAIARARGDAIWLLVNQECIPSSGRKFFSLQFVDLDK